MVREKDRDYICKYLPSDKVEEGLELLERGIAPQYIVGNVDFFGNVLEINNNVLIPRFETELLVEKTIGYIKKLFGINLSELDIIDIGTGSGCIAITLKKELNSRVVGVDISPLALEVAKRNVINNSVVVDFIQSDIFEGISSKFDVIISNPPYIRKDEEIDKIVYDNEPHLALYAEEDGLYFYHQILKNVSMYVKSKFLIAFEIGLDQGNKIKEMANQYLEDVKVVVEKDYSDRERFVFIYRD